MLAANSVKSRITGYEDIEANFLQPPHRRPHSRDQGLPLTQEHFQAIDNNVAPYLRD